MKQSVVDVDRIKKRIEDLQKVESEMDNIVLLTFGGLNGNKN